MEGEGERSTGVPAAEAMGDAAYGDGDTRQTFADAGRTLIATGAGGKRTFRMRILTGGYLSGGECYPDDGAGDDGAGQTGRTYRLAFRFDAAVCGVCPLRSQCVAAKPGTGNGAMHPRRCYSRPEAQSEAFAEYRQAAWWWSTGWRLVQLGPPVPHPCQNPVPAVPGHRGQLTLVAPALTGETGSGPSRQRPGRAWSSPPPWLGQIWTLSLLVSAVQTLPRGFRPGRSLAGHGVDQEVV